MRIDGFPWSCLYNASMNDPSPHPLRRLLPLAGRALQEALNRGLALDPAARESVLALAGQAIELHLEAPPLAMRIEVGDKGLRVGPAQPDREADLSLRATAGALLDRLLPAGTQPRSGGKLRISGDAELAQRLQKIAAKFDPDFDAAFASVFGEIIGPQVSRALREALTTGRAHARHLAEDTVDYLVEERRDLVSRAEQQQFFDEVDAVRDATDRLEARVRRLRERRNA